MHIKCVAMANEIEYISDVEMVGAVALTAILPEVSM